jgi:hypothetical protein
MTKPKGPAAADEPLFGVVGPAPGSALLAAIDVTIGHLADAGYVDPVRDAARVELCRELARVMADKRRTGRTASIGNDARVLQELLTGFADAAADADGDTMLREAMADWSKQLDAAAADPAP